MIRGIMGAAGAGKDTLGEIICKQDPEFVPVAFADPLKLGAAFTFGIKIENFYDRDLKEKVIPQWGMSPRQIAQKFGAGMREVFGEDFWIRRMSNMIEEFDVKKLVITDVRYQNEIDFVHNNEGQVLGVVRPGVDPVAEHDSEELAKQVHAVADVVFTNDGSIEDLRAKWIEHIE